MARKVFFSFHFKRDSWRVGQVRNCWVIGRPDHQATPFYDKAEWEKIERQGDNAIKNWIDSQLNGTSVTVVLIGAETADRPWVRYEIAESWNRNNGLVGIRIHNLKTPQQPFGDSFGPNPFERFEIKFDNGQVAQMSNFVKVYDWVTDDGRNNIEHWIEEAARARGR